MSGQVVPSRRRASSASAPLPTAAIGKRKRRTIRPVFIVSAARSGSTLLRYLLDTHPDIVSPPELNLSALLQHAAQTWHNASTSLDTPEPASDASAVQMIPEAYQWAKRVVDQILMRCARDSNASIYIDKSLTTVDQLATVSRCYPNAAYIFLYRYPLDMIASGIEASRWGFNAFGFTPYVGAAPGNFVAGLGNYWTDKVSKMLAFENACTVAHARIYYELLCDEPRETIGKILEFLDLPEDESLTERVFETDHGRGPGDYKIDFTDAIDASSVGRGSTLPELFGPEQTKRIDELLGELDYPSLASVRRGDLSALLGLKNLGRSHDTDDDEVIRLVIDGFGARKRESGGQSPITPPSFEIFLRGDAAATKRIFVHEDGAATLEGQSKDDRSPTTYPRVYCAGEVLLQVANGELNLAQAVHDGRVRVEMSGTASRRPQKQRILSALNSALRQAKQNAIPDLSGTDHS